jgi:hypothetical protein
MGAERPLKTLSHPHPVIWFLAFAIIFSCQVLPRLYQDSPCGDEVLDIGDGYYCWKGDVLTYPFRDHPPLAKALQALPLWAMGLRTGKGLEFAPNNDRNEIFLFTLNRDRFETLFAAARMVSFLFGLGIGFILFLIVRKGSYPLLIGTMALWATEPTLLGFSGIAMADVPLTFFFLLSAWKFGQVLKKPGIRGYLTAGFLMAMTITVKFSALILIPIFGSLEILYFWGESRNRTPLAFFTERVQRWPWVLGAAALWIFLVYLPATIFHPDHHGPFTYFGDSLHRMVQEHLLNSFPRTYFMGTISRLTYGSYYPVAFLIKSPLPFLVLLTLAFCLAASGRLKFRSWLWIPPLAFFAVIAPFHDYGIRNLLPIYPFCILMAARAGEWLWDQKNNLFKILGIGLLAFQVISVGRSFPSHISYFNEWVTQDKKIYWLGDSNLDIGQDTKRMTQVAKARGWDHVKLAYFGQTNPSLYGMGWDYWRQKDLDGPQPGWVYVINAAFLQLGPYLLPAASDIGKSWIVDTPPTGRIGDTWYYFEIPGKPNPDPSPRIISAPLFLYLHDQKP